MGPRISREQLHRFRSQGRALAELLDAEVGPQTGPQTELWIFADPAHERFAEELAPELMTRTDRLHVRGPKALVRITAVDGGNGEG